MQLVSHPQLIGIFVSLLQASCGQLTSEYHTF